ncbi:RNA polymerase II subunit A C-terminal domain phosphatase ssu72 [Nosema bombycis CQ1]|uniref:RNA polymerase II subunit A C-terminal domain phosphatase SSU72 n=1 Tax=Nosema bombycis (strain CQ1 / CVCC 102059) TaxID=578461 RepID=R0MEC6_NOSB1|nr:RNA polymerase II subunit A C-terminal domain phosphatase ssu72 [Nosema bombycis CQ1]|eukprot:EOB12435.1 RNA polymerase II subunit A C-terminal domain phosphatase ssu72 [Nosema bombycis CQ1]
MKIAVVCAMNQNRSMEAHKVLLEAGFQVDSYGTNKNIKIPGESIDKPNVYPFGVSYLEIYEDLKNNNEIFYERIGMLKMLKRNMKIKEKALNYYQCNNVIYDLVITAEEKCFTSIFNEINYKFLINFDIKDNLLDASEGAQEILKFVKNVAELKGGFEEKVKGALEKYTETTGKMLIFTCKCV